jgi:hypothetical protein
MMSSEGSGNGILYACRLFGRTEETRAESLSPDSWFPSRYSYTDFLNTNLTSTQRDNVIKKSSRGKQKYDDRESYIFPSPVQSPCLFGSALSYATLKIATDIVCLIPAPQNNVTYLFYYVTQLCQTNSTLKLAICLPLQAMSVSEGSRTRRCIVLNWIKCDETLSENCFCGTITGQSVAYSALLTLKLIHTTALRPHNICRISGSHSDDVE